MRPFTIGVYGHRKHPRTPEVFRAIVETIPRSFELVYVEEPGTSHVNANRVLERASEPLVCLLDYDAIPLTHDWIGNMIQLFDADPEIGLLGPAQVRDPSGRLQDGGLLGDLQPSLPDVQDFLCIPQTCLLLDRDRTPLLRFDETCPGEVNGSDMDLCFQAWSSGHRVSIAWRSVIFHDPSSWEADGRVAGECRSEQQAIQVEWLHRKWAHPNDCLKHVLHLLSHCPHPFFSEDKPNPVTGT